MYEIFEVSNARFAHTGISFAVAFVSCDFNCSCSKSSSRKFLNIGRDCGVLVGGLLFEWVLASAARLVSVWFGTGWSGFALDDAVMWCCNRRRLVPTARDRCLCAFVDIRIGFLRDICCWLSSNVSVFEAAIQGWGQDLVNSVVCHTIGWTKGTPCIPHSRNMYQMNAFINSFWQHSVN